MGVRPQSTASALFNGIIFRFTGSSRAGRELVAVLESEDEDARQIAGIMLLRNPDRAQPILEAAYEENHSEVVGAVLRDVAGDDRDLEELQELTTSENPAVAERAKRLLEERYGHEA